ncbi:MAG: CDP-alcohol phosphatidyltransferase family protein [Planctomycetota bacterium]
MSKRVSHSLLDPLLTTPLKGLYARFHLPASLPPEAIVCCGHLFAIVGAVGFAFSATHWWGGVLAALGVALAHTADVLDGTHARTTGQCRNGGELLDHFVDPLSFAYLVAGLAYSTDSQIGFWVGLAGVIVIYAMAVLTNIRAKMIGEFALARYGPTEFKTMLVLFGLSQSALAGGLWGDATLARPAAFWFMAAATAAGVVQLKISLWRAVREVNEEGAATADTTEWQIGESQRS